MNTKKLFFLHLFFGAFVLFTSFAAVNAAPPDSPYMPGETIAPTCQPGSANCTVYTPATSGANSNITSLSSLVGATSTNLFTSHFSISNLTGFLKANNGIVSTSLIDLVSDVTNVLGILRGGTGTSTAPTFGQLLLGNNSGGYDLVSTSSLGISGGSGGGGTVNLSDTTGTLGVSRGGTGATSFTQGWLYSPGGTTALSASTSPTVNYIVSTSTTATSTFGYGINLTGGCIAVNGTCIGGSSGGSGITSLNGLTGGTQTFTNDSNVTVSSSGSAHVLGWSGLLPVSRGGIGWGAISSGYIPFGNNSSSLATSSGLYWDTGSARLDATNITISNTASTTNLKTGRLILSGATPSISSCGTGASVSGSDSAGTISVGSGISVTSCTLTFSSSFSATPVCIAGTNSTGVVLGISSVSTSAVSFGLSLNLGSGKIYYHCFATQ